MVDGFVESWREPGQVVETNMAAIAVTRCKSDLCPYVKLMLDCSQKLLWNIIAIRNSYKYSFLATE